MLEERSPWNGRHVLVTGCTGFLGAAVSRELLARGAVVVGLVRNRHAAARFAPNVNAKRFHIVHGRVEDVNRVFTAMALHEVSAAFHLARSEATGDAAMSRAAALYHPRLPLITARPTSDFRIARDADSSVLCGVARFGEVFGGNPRSTGFVANYLRASILGEAVPRADGPVRDYVFIHDAARACLALAESVATQERSQDVAFRSGWSFAEKQMAAVLTGRSVEPEPGFPSNPFGWERETTLNAAVAETVQWYREFLEQQQIELRPVRCAA